MATISENTNVKIKLALLIALFSTVIGVSIGMTLAFSDMDHRVNKLEISVEENGLNQLPIIASRLDRIDRNLEKLLSN